MALRSVSAQQVQVEVDSALDELMREAVSGKTEAVARLLKHLAPGMIRAARVMLGVGHPDTDDVVQQSLIALVQALPKFRFECSPGHFASRIVAWTAVNARRRVQHRAENIDGSVELETLDAPALPTPDPVMAGRRRTVIRELLTELPPEQAESLALRFVLGFSLPEGAAATNAPVNTVRSRIRLAKEALRRRIDADPSLAEALEVDE